MPIESIRGQRELPFTDEEPGAKPFKLSDDILNGWEKIKAMPAAEAKGWLVVALGLLFGQDAAEEDEPAAEACAWRSEILPGRWRRKNLTL